MKPVFVLMLQIFTILHLGCGNHDVKSEVENKKSENIEAKEQCDDTECLEKNKKYVQEKRDELKTLLQEIKNIKDDINEVPNQVDIKPVRELRQKSQDLRQEIEQEMASVNIDHLRQNAEEAHKLRSTIDDVISHSAVFKDNFDLLVQFKKIVDSFGGHVKMASLIHDAQKIIDQHDKIVLPKNEEAEQEQPNEQKIVDDSSSLMRFPNNKLPTYLTGNYAVIWLALLIEKTEDKLKAQEKNIKDRFKQVEESLQNISDYLEARHTDLSCETDSEENENEFEDEDDQQ